jgi:Family of unknown function (DUF6416)
VLVDVTVKVPEELVGELYAAVARLLARDQPRMALQLVESADSSPKAWSDTDDDVPLAHEVWGKFSQNAKALFSRLMDNPGQIISGEDLAAEVGIPNGKYGIAGVLAWPGRHCAAVNRIPLWSWEYGPAGGSADYWVEKDVADLFKRVR